MSSFAILALCIAGATMFGLWISVKPPRPRVLLAALTLASATLAIAVLYRDARAHRDNLRALETKRSVLCREMALQLQDVDGVFASFDDRGGCRTRTGGCALRAFASGLEAMVSRVASECIAPAYRPSCDHYELWFPRQSIAKTRDAVRAHARAFAHGKGCSR